MINNLTRFWNKVDKSGGPDACWLWTASIHASGYGQLSGDLGSRHYYAHRLSWEVHFGPVPTRLLVCHHCSVRTCVNPTHLFLGSQADSLMGTKTKGRTGYKKHFGTQNARTKLTNTEVRDLRALWREYGGWGVGGARQGGIAQGIGHGQMAALFDVKASAARSVIYRKTWRFV